MDFPQIAAEVADRLGWYVYRLIDPRNGETFYVGKGQGGRLLAHVQAALKASGKEDDLSLKLVRIRQIQNDGLEVGHVVHRHGMEEETALEVEAALIDAYPGVTNVMGGHGSAERGPAHIDQLVRTFRAEEFVVDRPMLLISIGQYDGERSVYESVRGVWKISQKRAEDADLVLAHRRGLVIGVFKPERRLPATVENFPILEADARDRIGFVGKDAPDEIAKTYLRKRVPQSLRKRGAAFPVRYLMPAEGPPEEEALDG